MSDILEQKCQSQDHKNGFDDVERVGMLNQYDACVMLKQYDV